MAVELVTRHDELIDLTVDPLPHGLEPPPFGFTGRPSRVVSPKCVGDLIECESDILESTHHCESFNAFGREQSIVGFGTCRLWENTAALVVANCVDRNPSRVRQCTDAK